MLETEGDFQVIGECGDGLEAVQMVEQLKPDVLIVDLMMPGLNGNGAVTSAPEARTRTNER